MGSFTDKPVQFNPYIQQLPVEAMVEVGLGKQKLYDEGVERIQGSIDKIMDLDIAKDAHKSYLQSKLNELGHNLRGVAAGDFSNNQLVKSVSGMAGKLGRDPIVQNAVSSTASYRKQVGLMEEDRKAGKSNPANEAYFQKYASKWFKDPDLKAPFTASYIPYFDTGKLMIERMASIKPDGYDVTSIFQTDANGQIIIDPTTNLPIYSDVMIKLKKKGMFPEKVRAVVDSVLSDPRVSQQMQIDGEYNYRGAGPETLVKLIGQEGERHIAEISDRIASLEAEKSMTNDKETKDTIDTLISFQRNQIKDIQRQAEQNVILVENNPDGARGLIQTLSMRNSWMDMYTNLETETDYKVNPYVEVQMKKRQMDIEQKQWAMEYQLDREKFEYSKYKDARDLELEVMKENNKVKGELVQTTVDAMPGDIDMIKYYNRQRSTATFNFLKSTDDLLLATTVKGDPTIYMKAYKVSREEAVRMMIDAEAAKQKMTPAQFRGKKITEALRMLNKDPKNLTTEMSELKASFENASRMQQRYRAYDQDLDAKAPLSDDPTKDELQRRRDAIQNIAELSPYLSTTLITGKEEVDKRYRERIASIIGAYNEARQNTAKDFRKNVDLMTQIVKGEVKGSYKLQADRSTGTTKHRIKFYGEKGQDAGTMDITEGEANYLGISTKDWWQDEDTRHALQMINTRNGKTSLTDPSEVYGYYSNDAFFLKNDFPNLIYAPYDLKANIIEKQVVTRDGQITTKYIPYLFYNDGELEFVEDLPSAPSMEMALNSLRNMNQSVIDKLLYERQHGRR